jgi:hypothetical protein
VDSPALIRTGSRELPGGLNCAAAISDEWASRGDTLLPAQQVGVSRGDWNRFTLSNLASGRRIPWTRAIDTPPGSCDPECPAPETTFVAGDLDRLARGELLSPWFTVPSAGSVVLDHSWDLSALAADVALDGGRVLLRPQTGPDLPLTPPGGWGFTAERSIGNALGGRECFRRRTPHVFDLSTHRGEVVRLVLEAAGGCRDFHGAWAVQGAWNPAPGVAFRLEENPPPPVNSRPSPPRTLERVSPSRSIADCRRCIPPRRRPRSSGTEFVTELGSYFGDVSVSELVWTEGTARAGRGAKLSAPGSHRREGFLMVPAPRPSSARHRTALVGGRPERGPGVIPIPPIDLTGAWWSRARPRIDVAGTRRYWHGRDGRAERFPAACTSRPEIRKGRWTPGRWS